jgi:hypothetical protein
MPVEIWNTLLQVVGIWDNEKADRTGNKYLAVRHPLKIKAKL